MRLLEYFKKLFLLEKHESVNNEDEFVYKQFCQITSALFKKLVSMQDIEKNVSEDFALSNGGWFARAVALEIRSNFCLTTFIGIVSINEKNSIHLKSQSSSSK